MNEISAIEKRLQMDFDVENIDIESVSQRLTEHMRNKLYYTVNQFRSYRGCKISEDFSTKNLRETVFVNCTFDNANLSKTGLAGSIFEKTTFLSSDYTDTNFQSSDFRNCIFTNVELCHTLFNKSVFINTCFYNCIFTSVSMCDCRFVGCTFDNCQWIPVSVENTLFKDTSIKNTIFRSMNFEFATFDNLSTENIVLPFPTIPYIYGGISYIMTTTDNVKITSAKYKGGISNREYIGCLADLEQYYKLTQNYFPLCNILIAKKQFDHALLCVIKGLQSSILIRRFRMLVNYCKQLKYIPIVTAHTRQEVYINLMEYISHASLNSFERDNLSMYLPQASNILLEDSVLEKATVYIDTEINNTESDKIARFYSIIDTLLKDDCTYSIQLMHNSPIAALIQIFSDLDTLNIILSAISTVFIGIQAYSAIQNNKLQKESIQKDKETIIVEKERAAKQELLENNIVINQCTIQINGDVHIHGK